MNGQHTHFLLQRSWVWCVPRANAELASLALSILTPSVIHTQHSALFLRFCLFPISFLWCWCHMSCPQAGWEIFKASDSGARGPFDGASWDCGKGKDRGRKRKRKTGNPKPLVEFSFYSLTPPSGHSEECMWPNTLFISQAI